MTSSRMPALRVLFPLAAGVFAIAISEKAFAYAGLGPMIPMIGSWLVLVFISLITFVGVLLYPLKIVLKKFFSRKASKR